MTLKCKKCGRDLHEEHPRVNDYCVDCFAEEWAEVIEKSPIACPINLVQYTFKKVIE